MKKTLRAFSFFMAVICLFAFSLFEPIYAITEQTAADNQTSEAIAELNDIWDEGEKGSYLAYSPIVGELTDQRSEDTKRLRRADGAIELVMYSDPVHYELDGKWEQIDNTLVVKKTADGRMAFENLASDFQVQFGADEHIITITYNDEKLIFKQLDAEKGAVVTAAVKEKEATRGELTDEESDALWRFPEELSSAIVYTVENTRGEKTSDIEYKLNGKSLSEFITLNEKPAVSPVYRYRVESSLTPVLDGNVVRFENSDGKTVLMFSAPYMTDAKGEESYDFKVGIEKDADGYIYTMIPNEKWLYAKDRAYPVVIDPDVKPDYQGTISDTFISGANPGQCYSDVNGIKWDRMKIDGNDGHKYRSLIKLSSLEPIAAGDVILQATFGLSRCDKNTNFGKEIDAYRVRSLWDESNVTWNNFYANSNAVDTSRVESFVMSTAYNNMNILDITNLVKKWYAGTYTAEYTAMGVQEQYSIILQVADGVNNGYIEYRSAEFNSAGTDHPPYFSIIYVNSTGLEDRFSYSSQSVGRAGTGSVNLYSGNLTFSVSDASINNGTMPISVAHVYNTNDKDEDIGYGYGWRLNYAQYIEAVSLQDNNTTATYYEYIDGDGTRHYYKKETSTKYVNELDKDSVLTINRQTGVLTITDKGGNKLVFSCGYFDHDNNSSTQTEFLGHLTSVEDANGNKTLITYDPASFNGSVYRNMRITSITEKLAGNSSNGQSITLSYSGNRLSGMTAPNGLNQTFGYNGSGDLTSIGYTDGKSVTYTYSAHRLTKATNIDNYNINYEYNADNRVTKATEKAGTTIGNYLNYDYGWNVTTVTDKQNRDTIYQFNNAGQAVSIRNAEGQAVFAAYNKGDRETTQLDAVSKMQNTVVNLLANHGFDVDSNGTGWTPSANAVFYGGYPHTGQNSVKLPANEYVEQSNVAVESGKTYTLSAYFTGAAGGYVQVLNGSTPIATSDAVVTYGTTGTDWARGAVTFTVPSGVNSVKVRIAKNNSNTSNTWVDSAQLEVGETPNRYNMIVDSDFANGLTSYSKNGLSSTDTVVTDNDPTHPAALSSNVLKMTGSTATSKHVFQTIEVRGGKEGDAYSFGGWCRSDSAPLSTQVYNYSTEATRQYGLKCLKVQFYNGSTFVNETTAYFAADTTDWQFTSSSAVAESNYTKVRLIVCFDYTRNEAYFDGIQLYRERFSQSYTYDANGNLTGYTSLIGQEPKLTYDSNNNVTSSKDARGNTTSYTYSNSGNVHQLKTVLTPEKTKTEYTYDANGNVTQTKVSDNTNSSLFISTSTTYDSASALATAVTDARGNSVTYGYNSATRQQTSITDANGNQSTYSYGNAYSMLRLASLASAGTGTVSYSYDNYGKLTQIARSTTNYSFGYDSWGRLTTTKVGSATLSTNVYDAYGRLLRVDYGNGFKTRYEYDELDRVKKIYQGTAANGSSTAAYEFVYDGEGNLYELRNYNTSRAVFFEYDHAGKCMASTEKSFTVTGGKLSYTGTVSGYKYEYDANNNLTKLTCTVAGSSWATTYTYDKDNRPTGTLLSNGKTITDTLDRLGRLTKRRIGLSSAYETTIGYHDGVNGSKTALVATYRNGNDDAYTYQYDANGNITSITKGSMSFTYTYDAANQLIRENLYYGAGNGNNQTVTYVYDEWGNILKKRVYPYTTGDVAEPIEGYTLTFNGMGYIGASIGNVPAPITAAPGSAVTIPNMVPTQTYNGTVYTFDGWATTPSGGNRLYRPGSTIVLNSDITLYAQWSYGLAVPTPTPPGGIMGDDGDMDSIIGGDTEIQAVPDKEQPTRSNVYPTTVYVYKYNNASWKDQLSAIETYSVNANGVVSLANTQNFTYDSMGNPINYNGVSLTWQGKQLKNHTTTNGYMTTALHFAYDENGLRTQKTVSGFTTNYYYNGTVLIGMQKGNVTQRFSYDASGKVVSVNYNGTDYYYLRNAQGDIVKLIDNNKNTVVEYTYDSWGKILATTGSLANTVGTNQPFRYRGYVYDNETGWYYLQSRYYDPSTNRFISSDVYLSTGQGVLGHNSYAYCNNNPVNLDDAGGCIPHHNTVVVNDGGCGGKKDMASERFEYDRWMARVSDAPQIPPNQDPNVVLEKIKAGECAFYKGVIVIPFESQFFASCTPGPFIALRKDQTEQKILEHEYGHALQYNELGPHKYIVQIAIPSVIGRGLQECFGKCYEYYAQPWEDWANRNVGLDFNFVETGWVQFNTLVYRIFSNILP